MTLFIIDQTSLIILAVAAAPIGAAIAYIQFLIEKKMRKTERSTELKEGSS